jgi:hypothetical protein
MEILCKICNKKYASKNSLSNHIRLYHSNVGLPKVANGLPKVALSDIKEYKCNKCNKIYKYSGKITLIENYNYNQ